MDGQALPSEVGYAREPRSRNGSNPLQAGEATADSIY